MIAAPIALHLGHFPAERLFILEKEGTVESKNAFRRIILFIKLEKIQQRFSIIIVGRKASKLSSKEFGSTIAAREGRSDDAHLDSDEDDGRFKMEEEDDGCYNSGQSDNNTISAPEEILLSSKKTDSTDLQSPITPESSNSLGTNTKRGTSPASSSGCESTNHRRKRSSCSNNNDQEGKDVKPSSRSRSTSRENKSRQKSSSKGSSYYKKASVTTKSLIQASLKNMKKFEYMDLSSYFNYNKRDDFSSYK